MITNCELVKRGEQSRKKFAFSERSHNSMAGNHKVLKQCCYMPYFFTQQEMEKKLIASLCHNTRQRLKETKTSRSFGVCSDYYSFYCVTQRRERDGSTFYGTSHSNVFMVRLIFSLNGMSNLMSL